MTAVLTRPAIQPAHWPQPVVRPAPPREPPFDDELDPSIVVGPLDQPLPFDEWRPARRSLAVLPNSRARAALPRRTVPDPALWARRLLTGIIETAAGKRPLHQLAALVSPSVAKGLGADLVQTAGARHWTGAATVRSVRVTEPVEDVAELAATLQHGRRVRAVALRLELRNGRWCCTRLVLG